MMMATILPGSVKWLAQTRGDLLPQLSTDNEIYTINTGRYDEMGWIGRLLLLSGY